jgi:hypothetical protein
MSTPEVLALVGGFVLALQINILIYQFQKGKLKIRRKDRDDGK